MSVNRLAYKLPRDLQLAVAASLADSDEQQSSCAPVAERRFPVDRHGRRQMAGLAEYY